MCNSPHVAVNIRISCSLFTSINANEHKMSICIQQLVSQLPPADTAAAHYQIHYSTAAVQKEGNCFFDILKKYFYFDHMNSCSVRD